MGEVLFTSVRSLDRAENLKAVYEAYDGEKQFVQREWGKPIPELHSGRYCLMVTDELLNDTPGKSIWIGHGMGAGKTYGLQQPGTYYRKKGSITYAIASSKKMVRVVAAFCGIAENQVIPLGMPRTDAYFNKETSFHEGKKHLYVPTFRGGNWLPDFDWLSRLLPEDHELTVKLHMVTGDKVESSWDNIKTASAYVPSTPYLIETDTVITDYSSIMFDAMVLRKPLILFAKDKLYYLKSRGMYLPYPKDYSHYFAPDEFVLSKLIQEATWDDYSESRRKYYCGACDGHSTERMIDLIKECL